MINVQRPVWWISGILLACMLALTGCGKTQGGTASTKTLQPMESAKSQAPSNQPSQPQAQSGKSPAYQDSGFGFAYGKYGLYVPGAAYTTPVPGTDKEKVTVSAGAKTDSTLQVNADGTYVWNSAWDGKVLKGNWQKTGDSGYPIVLLKGQEGKDWKLGKGKNSEILLWDGDYMSYYGDRAN